MAKTPHRMVSLHETLCGLAQEVSDIPFGMLSIEDEELGIEFLKDVRDLLESANKVRRGIEHIYAAALQRAGRKIDDDDEGEE